jgi:hypothetical protein
METAYCTLVSEEFRNANEYQLITMNGCIKMVVYDDNANVTDVIVYTTYDDFCMHRKESHYVLNYNK